MLLLPRDSFFFPDRGAILSTIKGIIARAVARARERMARIVWLIRPPPAIPSGAL